VEQINRFLLGSSVGLVYVVPGMWEGFEELKHSSSQDQYYAFVLSRHFSCLFEVSSIPVCQLCIRNVVLVVIPTLLSHTLCSAKVFFTSSAKFSTALMSMVSPITNLGKLREGGTGDDPNPFTFHL